MLLWQAHNDLALAIGDQVTMTTAIKTDSDAPSVNNIMPDGTRFSKAHRDECLYRAQLQLLMDAIAPLINIPNKISAEIIKGIFPNLVKQEEVQFANHTNHAGVSVYSGKTGLKTAYILSIAYAGDDNYFPVPIKNHIAANGLLNSRVVQLSDLFATVNYRGAPINDSWTQIYIYDQKSELTDLSSVLVHYLPYPDHPSVFANNATMEIEEAYYPKLISLAKLYSLTDSQEIENRESFLQFELGVGNANNYNVNNNPAK